MVPCRPSALKLLEPFLEAMPEGGMGVIYIYMYMYPCACLSCKGF